MENNWLTWAASLVGIINAAILAYQAWKKFKPEMKKMDAEGDLDVLEGAEVSQNMLVNRVNELKQQIEDERKAWKSALDEEREARRRGEQYLRQRIAEAEGEAKAYRRWSAQLVKQVVEAGKVPAAFVPFTGDSETSIPAMPKDGSNEK